MNLKKNEYTYMYNWISLLYIWKGDPLGVQLQLGSLCFLALTILFLKKCVNTDYMLNAYSFFNIDIQIIPDPQRLVSHWPSGITFI